MSLMESVDGIVGIKREYCRDRDHCITGQAGVCRHVKNTKLGVGNRTGEKKGKVDSRIAVENTSD